METRMFDALARRTAGVRTRRSALGLVAGAVLAATRSLRSASANTGSDPDPGGGGGGGDDGGKGGKGGKGKGKDKGKGKVNKKQPCQRDYNNCATAVLAACGQVYNPEVLLLEFQACLQLYAPCCDLLGQCESNAGLQCLGGSPA
jgi:hypothetical protein